jgi:hypothetical protein
MGWTVGVLGFDYRQGLGIFLFTTASRTALGPTQSPIQWVTGALSLGVKLPGREADHSPPSSAEVKKCVELYIHPPNTPSWRGAQLKHRENFTFYLYSVAGKAPHLTAFWYSLAPVQFICIPNMRLSWHCARAKDSLISRKPFSSSRKTMQEGVSKIFRTESITNICLQQ